MSNLPLRKQKQCDGDINETARSATQETLQMQDSTAESEKKDDDLRYLVKWLSSECS